MQISVIIPVYNAASFVTQAVESALQQPETAEVILVEDGSPDDSWAVCQKLVKKHNHVHLFSHPNRENRGAGASRNLGMEKSSCEFIAFLDADDYYLPGRFTVANAIFDANLDCEGVYEAAGMHVENEMGHQRWKRGKKSDKALHTMTKCVSPEELGIVLISGEYGDFQLNGLVLKREVLEKSGYMVESLRLHQDTNFIIRVSIVARLMAGSLDKPVVMWRVHKHNRISAPRSAAKKYNGLMQFWMETYRWSKDYTREEVQKKILKRMMIVTMGTKHFFHFNLQYIPTTFIRTVRLLSWLFQYPHIMMDPLFRREMKPVTLWKMVRGQSF